jgi:hypothetical protein
MRNRRKLIPSPPSSAKDSRKPSTLERARQESTLLSSLLSNPRATLTRKKFREAVRHLDNWTSILEQSGGDKRIADILCAAEFWAKNVIRVRESRLPFNALDLRVLHQRDLKYHDYFKRLTRKTLSTLRQFREFLRDCEANSQGYKSCLHLCRQLIAAVEERLADEPSMGGTFMQEPTKPQPHTWAGAEIFGILRKKRQKKELALAGSAELVSLVFPELRASDSDRLKDSIWQAYLRSRKVRLH